MEHKEKNFKRCSGKREYRKCQTNSNVINKVFKPISYRSWRELNTTWITEQATKFRVRSKMIPRERPNVALPMILNAMAAVVSLIPTDLRLLKFFPKCQIPQSKA